MRTFAARLRNNGNKTSSLKRLIFILYKKQVPRKYNLSRSVNFF